MARPLRIEYPGAWHHVMNRGIARAPVFVDDADRAGFLELLVDARERWGLRTHVLCLMDNHIHLLVEDVRALLGRAMRHVFGVYTQRFNARRQRDGALFRGRYRSRLVQHELYLAELVRYLHMNPVVAGLVNRAGDYRWSSHPTYLSGAEAPWLVTEEVLRRFGGDPGALDAFVHARAARDEGDDALAWTRSPAILGDEAFVAQWRERLRGGGDAAPSLDRPARRWLATGCDEVIAAVGAHFGVAPEAVVASRRGRSNPARSVAILVCCDHTPASAAEVGEALDLNPTSFTSMALKYRRRSREDAAFAADVDAVLERLRDAAGAG